MNEQQITENIIKGTSMSLPQAVLYGVTPDGSTVELGRHGDIYALLENPTLPQTNGIVGIAIHTTGWAAPLKDGQADGAPSEHPDRVRCALVVVRTMTGFCSGLALADRDEVQYETDEAEGALWEAMTDCLDRLVG